MEPRGGSLPMTAVIRWIIQTLIRMAQRRDWGEIRIVVQDGQILTAHEQTSFRNRLPVADPKAAQQVAEVGRALAAAN